MSCKSLQSFDVLLGLLCHVSATSRSSETQHFPQYVSCSKDGRQLCTSNDIRYLFIIIITIIIIIIIIISIIIIIIIIIIIDYRRRDSLEWGCAFQSSDKVHSFYGYKTC